MSGFNRRQRSFCPATPYRVVAVLLFVINMASGQSPNAPSPDSPSPDSLGNPKAVKTNANRLLENVFGESLRTRPLKQKEPTDRQSGNKNGSGLNAAQSKDTDPADQNPFNQAGQVIEAVQKKSTEKVDLASSLRKKGNLTLSGTPLEKALFMIGDAWGVNLVVGDDVQGTATATFTNAPLHEILDSILLANGYGYRSEGESLVITSLQGLGDNHPLFERQFISLKFAEPEEVRDNAQLYSSPRGRIEIIPSGRSLLVIDFPEQIALIRDFATKMDALVEANRKDDTPAEARPSNAQVYRVTPKYIKAASLQESLATLISPAGKITLLEADNKIVVVDTPEAIQSIQDLVAQLDTPGSQIQVVDFRLHYVQAASILESVQAVLSPEGTATSIDDSNRVVIVEYPPVIDNAQKLITNLDQPRPQVRITALIYDMSLTDSERLGINWSQADIDARTSGGTPQTSLELRSSQLAAVAAGDPSATLTFTNLSRNFDIQGVLDLLCQSTDSRLLADPTVACVDRREATIEIVREIPYQQLSQSTDGGAAVGTTAFREAGISLTVTPRIANDGTTHLDVAPLFSVLTGFTPGELAQPIIDRREARTTVRVNNRQVLVIGGLRQRSDTHNYTGIPGLKDIKTFGIGSLFRSRTSEIRESELVLFLMPELITPADPGHIRHQQQHNVGHTQLNNVPVWPGPPYGYNCCGPQGGYTVPSAPIMESLPATEVTEPSYENRTDPNDPAPKLPALPEPQTDVRDNSSRRVHDISTSTAAIGGQPYLRRLPTTSSYQDPVVVATQSDEFSQRGQFQFPTARQSFQKTRVGEDVSSLRKQMDEDVREAQNPAPRKSWTDSVKNWFTR